MAQLKGLWPTHQSGHEVRLPRAVRTTDGQDSQWLVDGSKQFQSVFHQLQTVVLAVLLPSLQLAGVWVPAVLAGDDEGEGGREGLARES